MTQAARSLVTAAVLLVAYTLPTRAQEKPFHGWVLLGMGAGAANVACTSGGCPSGWKPGPTLLLTLGAMLTPHLGVGVGLDKWWRDPADTVETNTATLFFHYYPFVRAGPFIEGGAGLSRAAVWLDGDRVAQHKGLAVMAAVGYDVRLHRVHDADISLIPRVSYVYSSIGNLEYAAGSPPLATGWRHQVLSVGLGIGVVGPRTPQ